MKLTIIGCGVMGKAFARQLRSKVDSLIVCDRNLEKGKLLAKEVGGEFIHDPVEAAREVDVLLLAIKPKDVEGLAKKLTLSGQMVISILAGVEAGFLKELFPNTNVVRSMPNLALCVGESVIACVKDQDLSKEGIAVVSSLFSDLGMVVWVDEEKIDGITALAGSGPAFVIGMIEAMIEGGIGLGLGAEEAKTLCLQTILGTLKLIEEKGDEHPGGIRWEISAPGGTTIAGMQMFERRGVRAGIIDTLNATYKRAKEIL